MKFNDVEMQRIREIAESGQDGPVLMINIDQYSLEAGFPSGELYKRYMTILAKIVPAVGGRILWRYIVSGQVVGEQEAHEVLAAWYPTHQAFLNLRNAPDAEESFSLRALAVQSAVIHRVFENAVPVEKG